MAIELKTIPNGWVKDGTNGYYSATFPGVTKGSATAGANPNLSYTYSVNPETGARIIYANAPQISTGLRNQVTGQSFDIGGSRIPVMSIDANGNKTNLSGYNQIKASYGDAGLKALEDGSRRAASTFMTQTGTTSTVKNSKDFKSSLGNAATLNKDGTTGESSQNGDGAAGTPSIDKLSDINFTISDKQREVRQSYPKNLKYPADLDVSLQDYIKINMYRYVPTPLSASKISTGGGLDSSGRPFEKRNSIGQCILPIQGQVSDTNTVDWSGATLSPIEAMAASASYNVIKSDLKDVGDAAAVAAEGVTKLLKDNQGDVQNFVATYFAGKAAGAQNLLARTTGAIINPNMELLFNGPQLRQFTLSFRLSPRGRADVDNVRKIIRFFKQGMSVKRSSSDLFLKSPNTFQVQYINANKDHPYIGRLKECALLNCTVNYVPEGTYMTFAEVPSMTAYDMQLTFTELTPLYDGDYPNDNDASVGY